MKSPRKGFNPPDYSGQTKTLFVSEGNQVAMLMTNKNGQRNTGKMPVKSPEAALAWCRENTVVMVYLPVATERN